MAKLFFIAFLVSGVAQAQIFSLPFKDGETAPIDKVIESLQKLETDSAGYEDRFRQLTLEIERQLDIMRSDCQEKTGDAALKQRCFREVVTRHKKYLESSYDAKKTLLIALHKRQLSQLEEGREQSLKELDKQF